MTIAQFRFYEELNDFLAPERRRVDFEARCARAATVKHAIEALGVPHTEVELVLVNGRPVDFSYRMGEGDRVSVYPMFETFDIGAQLRVRPEPLRVPRFIADAHLGGLARYLRMLGFDTLYDNAWTDDEIRSRASDERRTVLTRDRALLMCASVTHGCYVHARAPKAQLVEIVQRLQLGACAKPFTLCLHCNLPLAPADPANLPQWIPPSVTARHRHFDACAACGRIYWQGSHWERMRTLLNDLLPDGIGPDAPRENIASDAATRLSDIPGSPP